jgi:lipopolysaccharide biosynthesis glycosyltransferase
MKVLAYYTIGLDEKYCEVVKLSIMSLRLFNPTYDILVLCDDILLSKCSEMLGTFENVTLSPVSVSITPQEASAHKLDVFSYEGVMKYDKIVYIDSDIVIHRRLDEQLNKVNDVNKLYCFCDRPEVEYHSHPYWSHKDVYSKETLEMFEEKKIGVFCAGFFAFVPSITMKEHFSAIKEQMHVHIGEYFYEQSHMNVYFNPKQMIDVSVFTPDVFQQGKSDNSSNEGKIVHFCGLQGGVTKLELMTNYVSVHIPELLT